MRGEGKANFDHAKAKGGATCQLGASFWWLVARDATHTFNSYLFKGLPNAIHFVNNMLLDCHQDLNF